MKLTLIFTGLAVLMLSTSGFVALGPDVMLPLSLFALGLVIVAHGCYTSGTIQQVEKEKLKWSKEIFPEATALGSLNKLIGEAQEIKQDIQAGKRRPEEFADVLMCLFDVAGRLDKPITPDEIFYAFGEKLKVNKKRKWSKNADNSYSHIK